MVFGGGDCGLEGRTSHDTRRPAVLLGPGDHDGADLAGRFRLALRQTEGLIGSIIGLLGLDLAIPDHSTLSRRAETLQVLPRPRSGIGPVHLLVDSTGLKLCGPGEWLVEKHGTRTRRSWRKLHIGVDAGTGQIMTTELTTNDVDDGSRVGPLLDQVAGPIVSFTGDGAYGPGRCLRRSCRTSSGGRGYRAATATAVPSETADTTPTQRDRHRTDRGARPHGLAEEQRLQSARLGRSGDRSDPRVIGDLSVPHASSSNHGSGRCCQCLEPDAGARVPEVRPYCLKPNWFGISASIPLIPATSRRNATP